MTMHVPHSWEQDPRDPLLTFERNGSEYGFFFPSIPAWIEILGMVILEACVASIVAVFVFHVVVRQPRTTLAYCFAFGLLIPLCFLLPFWLLELCSVKNKIFRFCLGGVIPTTSIFRTSEAAFGFTPAHATATVRQFALYFCSPMVLDYDPKLDKHKPASRSFILRRLGGFLTYLSITGIFQSLFELGFKEFPSFNAEDPGDYYSLYRLLDSAVWKDNLLYAILFQLYLCSFGEGFIFATALATGKEVMPLMDNPIFASRSPSDFWGRRWNHVVHQCLKGGAYKPTRFLTDSSGLGTMAAFVASGMFHEWLLWFVFFDVSIQFGPTSGFFVWQAMLVVIEMTCGDFFTRFKNLPRSVKSGLVVICGLPLAHWFTQYYVYTDFFLVAGAAFPMVKQMR